MNSSRRAKRMKRHHRTSKGEEGLILTSVIDIFTILVFFLLVHMGDEQNVQNTQSVKLPDSSSTDKPASALVVTVTESDLLVQGRVILSRSAIEAQKEETLPELKAELDLQQSNRVLAADPAEDKNPAIIMADRAIPYRLLKKIMYTLSEARYTDISLAVVQKE